MKDKKLLFRIGIVFLFLASVGFSYAYFTSAIANKDAKDQVVTTGTLELTYNDGAEIKMLNIKPGQTITKKVTVKNTGTLDTVYNFVWQELNNTITNDEMVISATCKRLNGEVEEESCEGVDETPIKENNIKKNVSIEPGITHEYNVTITFKETNAAQNYNQGKTFSGVLGINEYKVSDTSNCTFNGEMVQGAEFIKGRYTYRYKQEGISWSNIDDDGWGVQLTDKESTDAVTGDVCTYINDKPVVSAADMFYSSKASSIDLSGFDTSNVTDMSSMFFNTEAKNIIGLDKFNTSNVTNMQEMFSQSKVTKLDLSAFDTSNVTNMYRMFNFSEATSIDVSNFSIISVQTLSEMFSYSKATTLDLSSFGSNSLYDDGIKNMFYESSATYINLSNLVTYRITDMSEVFNLCHAEIIDISNFDTSNVTTMNSMFGYTDNLKIVYVGNNFTTDNISDTEEIFGYCPNLVGGAGTKFDDTKLNKTYARIDGGTSSPGYFTSRN